MAAVEATEAYTPAARAALQAFALVPEKLELIKRSENVTFRVRDARDGADYVLRLHRPGYHTLAELDAERVWIRALHAAGIAVPSPLLTIDQREYTKVFVAATGEHRHAGVTRWTEGDVLEDLLRHTENVGVIADYFAQLGAIVAVLHNQACDWRPPAAFQRHSLDSDGLMGDAPFWGPFWDHPVLSSTQRDLLLQTRDRLRDALHRYGTDSRTFSLIHADMHPGNLLVQGGELALIDFDDAGFGWHAYDIAVALNSYRSKPYYATVETAFLRGYQSVRAIARDTLALVPMFMLIRALAQLGWILQRPELRVPVSAAYKDALCAQCAAFQLPC